VDANATCPTRSSPLKNSLINPYELRLSQRGNADTHLDGEKGLDYASSFQLGNSVKGVDTGEELEESFKEGEILWNYLTSLGGTKELKNTGPALRTGVGGEAPTAEPDSSGGRGKESEIHFGGDLRLLLLFKRKGKKT